MVSRSYPCKLNIICSLMFLQALNPLRVNPLPSSRVRFCPFSDPFCFGEAWPCGSCGFEVLYCQTNLVDGDIFISNLVILETGPLHSSVRPSRMRFYSFSDLFCFGEACPIGSCGREAKQILYRQPNLVFLETGSLSSSALLS